MSRTRSLIAVLLAATSLTLTPALAQDTTKPAARPDRTTQQRAAFDRLDTNKDGFVDRDESHTAREAIFARLDANKDGRLTADELMGPQRTRRPPPKSQDGGINATDATKPTTDSRRARAERLLQRLDSDKDGVVSRAEWLAGDDTRFDRCDANKDGKLAFGECKMAQATRGDRRNPTAR